MNDYYENSHPICRDCGQPANRLSWGWASKCADCSEDLCAGDDCPGWYVCDHCDERLCRDCRTKHEIGNCATCGAVAYGRNRLPADAYCVSCERQQCDRCLPDGVDICVACYRAQVTSWLDGLRDVLREAQRYGAAERARVHDRATEVIVGTMLPRRVA